MIRLAVRVASAQAELVLAELLELAPAGVEESTPAAGVVEYAVYGAPGELPTLPDLHAAAGEALVEVHTSEISDDWNERWREFHRPVLIEAPGRSPGQRAIVPSLLVRPPWEGASDTGDEHVRKIVIDPGQAFGTGAHATTRMCLELLLELTSAEDARGAVLDVGTGSGVLAIAAATLGFAPVLGLDHDVESVTAARENAAVNHATIEVSRFDLRTQELPTSFPLLLANLLRPLLLELAAKLTEPPAHLIAGGILGGELDEVVHAFASQARMRERARREQGEWASVWLSAA